jgi:hypothetical protein
VKLLNYFKDFLDSTVNLNQTRLDLLDQRVQAIVSCLEDDSVIGTLIEDHIPQGSWAHRTIIRPLPGDEFDADFLLLLTEVEDSGRRSGAPPPIGTWSIERTDAFASATRVTATSTWCPTYASLMAARSS